MKTVEIWPKDIEGGDAIYEGVAVTYLKLTDPEDGVEVIAFIRPESLQTLIAQFATMAARAKNKN